ncbi:Probable ubiquitin-conjugating enzyme protein 17 [Durusdinium trenchii]|uniref:Probable ubiquitin-conjugating enzyme protein 17 n=1 Tax=Durusdinium trenchii TaxID=1381693 RepID=A0ABP0RLP7_9DINO
MPLASQAPRQPEEQPGRSLVTICDFVGQGRLATARVLREEVLSSCDDVQIARLDVRRCEAMVVLCGDLLSTRALDETQALPLLEPPSEIKRIHLELSADEALWLKQALSNHSFVETVTFKFAERERNFDLDRGCQKDTRTDEAPRIEVRVSLPDSRCIQESFLESCTVRDIREHVSRELWYPLGLVSLVLQPSAAVPLEQTLDLLDDSRSLITLREQSQNSSASGNDILDLDMRICYDVPEIDALRSELDRISKEPSLPNAAHTKQWRWTQFRVTLDASVRSIQLLDAIAQAAGGPFPHLLSALAHMRCSARTQLGKFGPDRLYPYSEVERIFSVPPLHAKKRCELARHGLYFDTECKATCFACNFTLYVDRPDINAECVITEHNFASGFCAMRSRPEMSGNLSTASLVNCKAPLRLHHGGKCARILATIGIHGVDEADDHALALLSGGDGSLQVVACFPYVGKVAACGAMDGATVVAGHLLLANSFKADLEWMIDHEAGLPPPFLREVSEALRVVTAKVVQVPTGEIGDNSSGNGGHGISKVDDHDAGNAAAILVEVWAADVSLTLRVGHHKVIHVTAGFEVVDVRLTSLSPWIPHVSSWCVFTTRSKVSGELVVHFAAISNGDDNPAAALTTSWSIPDMVSDEVSCCDSRVVSYTWLAATEVKALWFERGGAILVHRERGPELLAYPSELGRLAQCKESSDGESAVLLSQSGELFTIPLLMETHVAQDVDESSKQIELLLRTLAAKPVACRAFASDAIEQVSAVVAKPTAVNPWDPFLVQAVEWRVKGAGVFELEFPGVGAFLSSASLSMCWSSAMVRDPTHKILTVSQMRPGDSLFTEVSKYSVMLDPALSRTARPGSCSPKPRTPYRSATVLPRVSFADGASRQEKDPDESESSAVSPSASPPSATRWAPSRSLSLQIDGGLNEGDVENARRRRSPRNGALHRQNVELLPLVRPNVADAEDEFCPDAGELETGNEPFHVANAEACMVTVNFSPCVIKRLRIRLQPLRESPTSNGASRTSSENTFEADAPPPTESKCSPVRLKVIARGLACEPRQGPRQATWDLSGSAMLDLMVQLSVAASGPARPGLGPRLLADAEQIKAMRCLRRLLRHGAQAKHRVLQAMRRADMALLVRHGLLSSERNRVMETTALIDGVLDSDAVLRDAFMVAFLESVKLVLRDDKTFCDPIGLRLGFELLHQCHSRPRSASDDSIDDARSKALELLLWIGRDSTSGKQEPRHAECHRVLRTHFNLNQGVLSDFAHELACQYSSVQVSSPAAGAHPRIRLPQEAVCLEARVLSSEPRVVELADTSDKSDNKRVRVAFRKALDTMHRVALAEKYGGVLGLESTLMEHGKISPTSEEHTKDTFDAFSLMQTGTAVQLLWDDQAQRDQHDFRVVLDLGSLSAVREVFFDVCITSRQGPSDVVQAKVKVSSSSRCNDVDGTWGMESGEQWPSTWLNRLLSKHKDSFQGTAIFSDDAFPPNQAVPARFLVARLELVGLASVDYSVELSLVIRGARPASTCRGMESPLGEDPRMEHLKSLQALTTRMSNALRFQSRVLSDYLFSRRLTWAQVRSPNSEEKETVQAMYHACNRLQEGHTLLARAMWSNCIQQGKDPITAPPLCRVRQGTLTAKLLARFLSAKEAAGSKTPSYGVACELLTHMSVFGNSRSMRGTIFKFLRAHLLRWPSFTADVIHWSLGGGSMWRNSTSAPPYLGVLVELLVDCSSSMQSFALLSLFRLLPAAMEVGNTTEINAVVLTVAQAPLKLPLKHNATKDQISQAIEALSTSAQGSEMMPCAKALTALLQSHLSNLEEEDEDKEQDKEEGETVTGQGVQEKKSQPRHGAQAEDNDCFQILLRLVAYMVGSLRAGVHTGGRARDRCIAVLHLFHEVVKVSERGLLVSHLAQHLDFAWEWLRALVGALDFLDVALKGMAVNALALVLVGPLECTSVVGLGLVDIIVQALQFGEHVMDASVKGDLVGLLIEAATSGQVDVSAKLDMGLLRRMLDLSSCPSPSLWCAVVRLVDCLPARKVVPVFSGAERLTHLLSASATCAMRMSMLSVNEGLDALVGKLLASVPVAGFRALLSVVCSALLGFEESTGGFGALHVLIRRVRLTIVSWFVLEPRSLDGIVSQINLDLQTSDAATLEQREVFLEFVTPMCQRIVKSLCQRHRLRADLALAPVQLPGHVDIHDVASAVQLPKSSAGAAAGEIFKSPQSSSSMFQTPIPEPQTPGIVTPPPPTPSIVLSSIGSPSTAAILSSTPALSIPRIGGGSGESKVAEGDVINLEAQMMQLCMLSVRLCVCSGAATQLDRWMIPNLVALVSQTRPRPAHTESKQGDGASGRADQDDFWAYVEVASKRCAAHLLRMQVDNVSRRQAAAAALDNHLRTTAAQQDLGVCLCARAILRQLIVSCPNGRTLFFQQSVRLLRDGRRDEWCNAVPVVDLMLWAEQLGTNKADAPRGDLCDGFARFGGFEILSGLLCGRVNERDPVDTGLSLGTRPFKASYEEVSSPVRDVPGPILESGTTAASQAASTDAPQLSRISKNGEPAVAVALKSGWVVDELDKMGMSLKVASQGSSSEVQFAALARISEGLEGKAFSSRHSARLSHGQASAVSKLIAAGVKQIQAKSPTPLGGGGLGVAGSILGSTSSAAGGGDSVSGSSSVDPGEGQTSPSVFPGVADPATGTASQSHLPSQHHRYLPSLNYKFPAPSLSGTDACCVVDIELKSTSVITAVHLEFLENKYAQRPSLVRIDAGMLSESMEEVFSESDLGASMAIPPTLEGMLMGFAGGGINGNVRSCSVDCKLLAAKTRSRPIVARFLRFSFGRPLATPKTHSPMLILSSLQMAGVPCALGVGLSLHDVGGSTFILDQAACLRLYKHLRRGRPADGALDLSTRCLVLEIVQDRDRWLSLRPAVLNELAALSVESSHSGEAVPTLMNILARQSIELDQIFAQAILKDSRWGQERSKFGAGLTLEQQGVVARVADLRRSILKLCTFVGQILVMRCHTAATESETERSGIPDFLIKAVLHDLDRAMAEASPKTLMGTMLAAGEMLGQLSMALFEQGRGPHGQGRVDELRIENAQRLIKFAGSLPSRFLCQRRRFGNDVAMVDALAFNSLLERALAGVLRTFSQLVKVSAERSLLEEVCLDPLAELGRYEEDTDVPQRCACQGCCKSRHWSKHRIFAVLGHALGPLGRAKVVKQAKSLLSGCAKDPSILERHADFLVAVFEFCREELLSTTDSVVESVVSATVALVCGSDERDQSPAAELSTVDERLERMSSFLALSVLGGGQGSDTDGGGLAKRVLSALWKDAVRHGSRGSKGERVWRLLFGVLTMQAPRFVSIAPTSDAAADWDHHDMLTQIVRSESTRVSGSGLADLDDSMDDFVFDIDRCSTEIELHSSDHVASFTIMPALIMGSSWGKVMGKATLSGAGTFEWEVIVEQGEDAVKDGAPGLVSIGVCLANSPLTTRCGGDAESWGISSDGTLWHSGNSTPYPVSEEMGVTGARVQVSLNLGAGELSFSVNGKSCGVAFRDLPLERPFRPAVAFSKHNLSARLQARTPGEGDDAVDALGESEAAKSLSMLCAIAALQVTEGVEEGSIPQGGASSSKGQSWAGTHKSATHGPVRRFVSSRQDALRRLTQSHQGKNRAMIQKFVQSGDASRNLSFVVARRLLGLEGDDVASATRPLVTTLRFPGAATVTGPPRSPLVSRNCSLHETLLWAMRPYPVLCVPGSWKEVEAVWGSIVCGLLPLSKFHRPTHREALELFSTSLFEGVSGDVSDEVVRTCECTFVHSRHEFVEQDWFHCLTCNLLGSEGCCVSCAINCHRGHELRYNTRSRFYCDCGPSDKCRSLSDASIGFALTSSGRASEAAALVDAEFALDRDAEGAARRDVCTLLPVTSTGKSPASNVKPGAGHRDSTTMIAMFCEEHLSHAVEAIREGICQWHLRDQEGMGEEMLSAVDSASLPGDRRDEVFADLQRVLLMLSSFSKVATFQQHFARNEECIELVVVLMHALRPKMVFRTESQGNVMGVSSTLYLSRARGASQGLELLVDTDICDKLTRVHEDPVSPMVKVFAAALDDVTSPAALVESRALDLLLIRLGDILGECPVSEQLANEALTENGRLRLVPVDRTTRKPPQLRGAATPAKAQEALQQQAEGEEEETDPLWKPSYGVGSSDQAAEDEERATKVLQRRSKARETIDCICKVLGAILGTARSGAGNADDVERTKACLRDSCFFFVLHYFMFGNTVDSLLENAESILSLLQICRLLHGEPLLEELLDFCPPGRKCARELVLEVAESGQEAPDGGAEDEGDDAEDDAEGPGDEEERSAQQCFLRMVAEAADLAKDLSPGLAAVAVKTAEAPAEQEQAAISEEPAISEEDAAGYVEELKGLVFQVRSLELSASPPPPLASAAANPSAAATTSSSGDEGATATAKVSGEGVGVGGDDAKEGSAVAAATSAAATAGEVLDHAMNDLILADAAKQSSRARTKRVNRELRSLKKTLPVHLGSTIALCVDSKRPFVLKAAIMAPEGTPYDSGVFVFDIYLPVEYPEKPPMMLLRTTGDGTVRFNPNLYNNGKVCLSLLGTWRGGASGNETWTKHSTLLQVLVSTQSAILGAELPYFNEPGVEAQFGTPDGELQARVHENGGYERLRVATIRFAMLAHLQVLLDPDAVDSSGTRFFAQVVRAHFRRKQAHILRTVDAWIAQAQFSDTVGHLAELQRLRDQLADSLDALRR